jgi:HlyD family secretion protein
MSTAANPSAPRKKSSAKWWLIGGTVLVVVLCVVAVAVKKKGANKGIPITVEKAEVRNITQVVTATGKVQPEVEVKISPEVYGEITSLPLREGAHVTKGQLVVTIKPDMYQAQVDQQTAAVAAARSAAVLSHAKLNKAISDLKQYQDLYDRKLVSEADFLTYKTNYDVANADFTSATATVQQVEGLLSQSKDALSKTTIYSPMDGTVSARESEVGERVVATGSFAGTEIMRIADLSNMEVRVNVNENDIVNVKVGDPVVISIDAYPDRKFSGKVREIAASAANSGASGSGSSTTATTTDEVTNFVVKIRIADRDVQLQPGMSATADIQTQSVSNVVSIPIQSVAVRSATGESTDQIQKKKEKAAEDRSGGADLSITAEKTEAKKSADSLNHVVFIKQGDKVKMVKVVTGIADNTYIEVKSGVKAGDEVVSGTYAAISRKLKDGSDVQLEKPKVEDDSGNN